MKKKSGSVLIFSLMIVSLIILLTQQLVKSVWVSSSFIDTMINRERAEMLVLAGINIALTQVAQEQDEEVTSGTDKEKNEKKESSAQKLMFKVLPHLNRWQSFKFEKDVDGIQGELKLCITSEHGKININEIFDFKKLEMKKEYEAMLQGLEIKGVAVAGELYKKLVEFLTNRRKKLHDISELYQIPEFQNLDIFYRPPLVPMTKNNKAEPNSKLTLLDIFTIWTKRAAIHPLLFSDSLCAILGLRRPMADDAQQLEDKFKTIISSYEPSWEQNWYENWKNLVPIYEQQPKFLKNIQKIFSKQFEPKVYSVLCYGIVGNVEQRLLAIIDKIEPTKKTQGEDQKDGAQASTLEKDEKEDESLKQFKITRIYWL